MRRSQKAYGGKRRVAWFEVFAGEKAKNVTGEWLPNDTLEAVKAYSVAIKGPLTTPVGGGIRSLNVTLRQVLDLYACIRPVRYFDGTPSPVNHPEQMNVVIFRENTEDVYAGIEWAKADAAGRKRHRVHLKAKWESGSRPTRASASSRCPRPARSGSMRMAIQIRDRQQPQAVTLVHKGNIMKFTEGAFRDWGYELAKAEFRDRSSPKRKSDERRIAPTAKSLINDRDRRQRVPADPDAARRVRRLRDAESEWRLPVRRLRGAGRRPGMAPGANIGDEIAFFEATHGTAPKYAGKDVINPASVILSGVMMCDYLGWTEAGALIEHGLEKTIEPEEGHVRPGAADAGATELKTSAFADAIISNM